MSKPQRTDNKKSTELLTAEVTSGQLVVIICVSLFVALACFGLGILVARIDPSFKQAEQPAVESPPSPETVTYTIPVMGEAESDATGAASEGEADSGAQRTPETPPPRSPFMDNKPRLTALPPLQPQRSTALEVEAPSRAPRAEETPGASAVEGTPAAAAPAALPAAAPAAPPQTVSASPAAPAAAPAAPSQTGAASLAAPAAVPAAPAQAVAASPAPPATQAPPTPVSPQTAVRRDRGKFGVQLAAFSGADRRQKAEQFQRLLREQLKVDAELIPSDDDAYHRVIVVGFSSRDAANAAAADLRRKAGLNEAFVRPL